MGDVFKYDFDNIILRIMWYKFPVGWCSVAFPKPSTSLLLISTKHLWHRIAIELQYRAEFGIDSLSSLRKYEDSCN